VTAKDRWEIGMSDEWENAQLRTIDEHKRWLKQRYSALLHERYVKFGIDPLAPVTSDAIDSIKFHFSERLELSVVDSRTKPPTDKKLTIQEVEQLLKLYERLIAVCDERFKLGLSD
jgi:hypothetical protein